MNDIDPLSGYERAGTAAQRLVDGIRAEQWSSPTPCSEWDVRALVNHVVGGMVRTTAVVRGEEPPVSPGDFLGDDPPARFAEATTRMRDAFRAPGVLGRVYPSPVGDLPGVGLVQIRITEFLVHGWDLARATGQQADLPEDVAERNLSLVRATLDGRPREGGMFGVAKEAPDGSAAVDRLAAYLGREL